jgi:hypothetical protein
MRNAGDGRELHDALGHALPRDGFASPPQHGFPLPARLAQEIAAGPGERRSVREIWKYRQLHDRVIA